MNTIDHALNTSAHNSLLAALFDAGLSIPASLRDQMGILAGNIAADIAGKNAYLAADRLMDEVRDLNKAVLDARRVAHHEAAMRQYQANKQAGAELDAELEAACAHFGVARDTVSGKSNSRRRKTLRAQYRAAHA